ncbi:hypothetical protein EAX61_11565 [Dokdonia sinensis]|uniref:Lipocalin-like domain-containing protein n=1 Tax=Dokdonia sinensis TaxID=2479847 RepID=A0A3M0FZP3_9FLAO|nr:hypothetical protein [Dokdonia sinensis]RMB57377.1 hypothetical protein EAX61_11565 [Dokdonia sinensis]
MKKINLASLILISLMFINCSSDDDDDNQEAASIIGQWKLESKLFGGNQLTLDDCEQGEGVIFTDNFIANFIIVDIEGFEPDIIQEGFEDCDFRYAEYTYLLNETNKLLYRIVEGEGATAGVDDSITIFEIEILNNQSLRIKSIARSNQGTINDVEMNSVDIDASSRQTLIYTR